MKLDPERFIPIQINNKTTTNLHKHRLYYGVVCEDGDFFQVRHRNGYDTATQQHSSIW